MTLPVPTEDERSERLALATDILMAAEHGLEPPAPINCLWLNKNYSGLASEIYTMLFSLAQEVITLREELNEQRSNHAGSTPSDEGNLENRTRDGS